MSFYFISCALYMLKSLTKKKQQKKQQKKLLKRFFREISYGRLKNDYDYKYSVWVWVQRCSGHDLNVFFGFFVFVGFIVTLADKQFLFQIFLPVFLFLLFCLKFCLMPGSYLRTKKIPWFFIAAAGFQAFHS